MHPQLTALEAELDAARARLHRLVAGLAPETWASRPRPESWSPSECVAHLNLTSRAYITLLGEAFESARAAGRVGAPRRYRRDAIGWMLSVTSGPLPTIGRWRLGRVKTMPAFVPGGELQMQQVMDEFDRLQAEQVGLVRAGDGLPLDRITITSPFDARVHYNAYSALVVLPRHQQRHIGQAERAARGEP